MSLSKITMLIGGQEELTTTQKEKRVGIVNFECIEGKWENELSDGWWEYEFVKEYFEIID